MLTKSASVVVALAATMFCAHSAELPTAVEAAISEERKACEPDALALGDEFVRRQDVYGDGIRDFVLDYGHARCGDMVSFYCGTGGCLTKIVASVDEGFELVFNDLVRGMEFKDLQGRPAMTVDLHGSACGRPGAEQCSMTLYWNGDSFSPAN